MEIIKICFMNPGTIDFWRGSVEMFTKVFNIYASIKFVQFPVYTVYSVQNKFIKKNINEMPRLTALAQI